MLKSHFTSPTEDAKDNTKPSQDTSCRFALDDLLRKNGFIPWERKKNREAVWLRKCDRQRYLESEALKLLPKEDVADANYASELYYDLREDGLI